MSAKTAAQRAREYRDRAATVETPAIDKDELIRSLVEATVRLVNSVTTLVTNVVTERDERLRHKVTNRDERSPAANGHVEGGLGGGLPLGSLQINQDLNALTSDAHTCAPACTKEQTDSKVVTNGRVTKTVTRDERSPLHERQARDRNGVAQAVSADSALAALSTSAAGDMVAPVVFGGFVHKCSHEDIQPATQDPPVSTIVFDLVERQSETRVK